MYKLGISPLLHKYVPNGQMRYYLLTIVVTVPIFCIYTSKISSIGIYNNIDIKYAKIISSDNSISSKDTFSLKLLGFLGDKIILSSLDNKRIEVVNQSSFDAVILQDSLPIFKKEVIKTTVNPLVDSTKNITVPHN